MPGSQNLELLVRHNLRPTEGRKEILDVIRESKCALSHPEIEERLSIRLDRITTYRTLQSFKKKGIIHLIVDPHSGTAKYIFSDNKMSHSHAHFKCLTCGIMECMPTQTETTDFVKVPPEYKAIQYSFVIEGLCPRCH